MQLQLISLFCSCTEDDSGADEPYILINGKKVWGMENPGLNDKETADLSGLDTFEFDTKARAELFDDDPGSGDDDDLLDVFKSERRSSEKESSSITSLMTMQVIRSPIR